MCELLGISSSTKVRPGHYFRVFRQRGQEFEDGQGNPDGWGIACYPDGGKAVQVVKESIPAASSKLAKFVSTYEYLCSTIFVAHVRKASQGIVAYHNTHPFSREAGGREYVFAHNGTIRTVQKFSLGRHKPVGSTDSEYLFCHILNFIDQRDIGGWTEDYLIEFWKFLVAINCWPTEDQEKPNKINLLITDGVTLLAYTDYFGNGTLHQLHLRLTSEAIASGRKISGCPQTKHNDEESICVVATRPISGDKLWVSVGPGELRAFRNGAQVFSSGALRSGGWPQLAGKSLPG